MTTETQLVHKAVHKEGHQRAQSARTPEEIFPEKEILVPALKAVMNMQSRRYLSKLS